MFVQRMDPPHPWVIALDAISPCHDRLSHLELWWEAGLPWAPVQRWVLYQLQPFTGMHEDGVLDWLALLDLERPCQCAYEWARAPEAYTIGMAIPRELARCQRCQRMRTPSRTNILTAALQGYQAAPFWVLQGAQGGHKLQYTTEESTLASGLGMSGKPPVPGALPYAPFDLRVVANLRAYDLATSKRRSFKSARADERDRVAKEARIASERYLTGIMEQAKDQYGNDLVNELPSIHGSRGPDEQDASARYIDTGRL